MAKVDLWSPQTCTQAQGPAQICVHTTHIPDREVQNAWWCMPSTQETRQEDQKFKIILGYIASSRPAWATQDPIFKILPKHLFSIQQKL
ncbi:hypothetical protein I79_024515 [Cricetulus griseus]|uniref:Uncharacterized protein n=1 Tax=Cricetulus griseus TaxID=10029 RepID=G3IKW1_CRIGR|nr:hypothetical protein I79_024515 [Cricetulus griseus]